MFVIYWMELLFTKLTEEAAMPGKAAMIVVFIDYYRKNLDVITRLGVDRVKTWRFV